MVKLLELDLLGINDLVATLLVGDIGQGDAVQVHQREQRRGVRIGKQTNKLRLQRARRYPSNQLGTRGLFHSRILAAQALVQPSKHHVVVPEHRGHRNGVAVPIGKD